MLCVAEKPSLAGSIAQHLSDGSCVERKATQSVHEFRGRFKNQPAHFKVTSVIGHVYTTDFAEAYQSWELDPARLFDAPTVRMESNPRARICEHLRQEARSCHYLVLWLDCDREGEAICWEVIDCVRAGLSRSLPHGTQQIFRAKFSAVTPSDINKAMASLGHPDRAQADAVEVRQELDLKVGFAMTRFQTRHFNGRFDGLDAKTISYGPCQTPTLGFVVARDDEINAFTPEPYWTLDLALQCGGGERVQCAWDRGRVFDPALGEVLEGLAVAGPDPHAVVTRVSSKESRRVVPRYRHFTAASLPRRPPHGRITVTVAAAPPRYGRGFC